jgi:hypothetical protein
MNPSNNPIFALFFSIFLLSILMGCITESPRDSNIKATKQIVEDYHETHTYIGKDVYVCGDMSSDVWNMLETKNINAVIVVGNVEKDITSIKDANHVWVIAEVSPDEWIALETTGGYLVCADSNLCSVNNPRYYKGWNFENPKELKDALEDLKHPCPDGYVFGSDQLCHPACGGSKYCTGNSICIDGECKSCKDGYILGEDLKCHEPCGSSQTYCTGDSVCVNGRCVSCEEGYILGNDLKCHQPCGSTQTYCPDNSICVNGRCIGY